MIRTPRLLLGHEWAREFCDAAAAAKQSLHVLTFTVLQPHGRETQNDQSPFCALIDAARRGLTVQLCRSHAQNIAYTRPGGFFAARILQDSGIEMRVHPSRPTLHAKMLLIDDRYALIGSPNISTAAARSNVELATWLDDADSITTARAAFDACWNRSAPEPRPLITESDQDNAHKHRPRTASRYRRRVR